MGYMISPRAYGPREAQDALTAPGMPFETIDVVIRGVPQRVFRHAHRNMRGLLEHSRSHGPKAFVVLGHERMTFEEHYLRVASVAAALVRHANISKGDKVAILMRNCLEWVVAFWAVTALGAIAVPVNAWLKTAEIEYCLRKSESVFLFTDAERFDLVGPVLPQLQNDGIVAHVVIVARSSRVDQLPPGVMKFETFEISGGRPATLPPAEIDSDDDATMFFTSGTTGKPKGALGTHRNYVTNIVSSQTVAPRNLFRKGAGLPDPASRKESSAAAILLAIPLFHVTGNHFIMGVSMQMGRKVVMMDRWDASAALALVERERITVVGGVPALVWQLIEHPDRHKYDLSSISSFFYGGAPAAKELGPTIRKNLPKKGGVSSNGFGTTETSGMISSNMGVDAILKPDSVGPLSFVMDYKILRPGTWEELPPGSIGEIAVKGPNVVKGYYKDPDATRKSFSADGYFATGDIGRVDEDRFIYILDRAKDVVIRAGENVYCVEVEDCIYEHEAVMDCAVIGIPHKVLGEEVASVVQIKPQHMGKVQPEDIIKHCQARIARFKCPVFIQIRHEPLPRNANGKIMKAQLRDELAQVYSAGRSKL